MIEMVAEKFFGEKDVLVREVWGSIAYGKSTADTDVANRIEWALIATEAQADDNALAKHYDMKSQQYPDAPDVMLQQILSDKQKYIPYLAAQLKDLFVEEHKDAEKRDGNYI